MSNNIQSFLRLRAETTDKKSVLWDVLSPNVVYSLSENKHYIFNEIFGSNCSTKKIFNDSFLPLVRDAINGDDLAIVVTGPKNSGKTFTLVGTKVYPGLVNLTVDYIFDYISSNSGEFLLSCTYLEAYKDNFLDLISGQFIEDLNDKNIRREICLSPKHLKYIISAGNNRKHTDCHSIFTIIFEALQDDLKITKIRFFDLAGINCEDSEKVKPRQKLRPIRQLLLSKQPKSKYESFLLNLLCQNIAILATVPVSQSSSELNSMMKFLDRLRSTFWHKENSPNWSTLAKLKRKLEKIKDLLAENPEDSSLKGEYEVVKSKIISSENSINAEFQSGINDVREVKIMQNQASCKENFLFDVMLDPCMPLPHEEWIKLIVEQDVQVTQIRHSLGVVEQENVELAAQLGRIKDELEHVKRNAFNYL